ncbi:MAG TPA: hypothetical protein VMB71_04230 [Acetobacteraceae bacterium]|nr:hypothetical protein [Acetobacteraceae bacterium]
MLNQAWATLLGFVILSLTVAVLARYDAAPMPEGGALITDRWFGTVRFCTAIVDNVTVVCLRRFPPTFPENARVSHS